MRCTSGGAYARRFAVLISIAFALASGASSAQSQKAAQRSAAVDATSCYGCHAPIKEFHAAGKHKAVRLVFQTGLIGQYWGIEETDWNSAPALGDTSFRHDLGGREFDLYYNGSRLQMVVLRANGATYWVVNTLSDTLSNETMLAIDRVRFTLGDGIVVYAPSPMSFRASVGLEVGWQ